MVISGPEILKGGTRDFKGWGAWFFGARGAGRVVFWGAGRGARGPKVGQLAVTPTKKYWVDLGRGWPAI